MRTTFLLPLPRMLEAFYRAIKAVNQSLLNDPWFPVCFTGSDTVVAAHCSWLPYSVASLAASTKWGSAWTLNTLRDSVIALLRCLAVRIVVGASRVCRSKAKRKRDVQKQSQAQRKIHWLARYSSCPCIPVETYLRMFVQHANLVLQGTYRQLMCFLFEAVEVNCRVNIGEKQVMEEARLLQRCFRAAVT